MKQEQIEQLTRDILNDVEDQYNDMTPERKEEFIEQVISYWDDGFGIETERELMCYVEGLLMAGYFTSIHSI